MARKKTEFGNQKVVSILSHYAEKKGVPLAEIPILPLRNALETDAIATAQMGDDSLIEKGILQGDYLVFSLDAKIDDGDIAVVVLGGELATRIVRFFDDGLVRLDSANKQFKPVIQKLSDTKLIGRLMRSERDW